MFFSRIQQQKEKAASHAARRSAAGEAVCIETRVPEASASRYVRLAERLPGAARKGECSWRTQNARNHPRGLGADLSKFAKNGHVRSVELIKEIWSDHST